MRPSATADSPARHRARATSYDVVALVASAGGHGAIEVILRSLPADFPVPIVVMQHLSHNVAEPLVPYSRESWFLIAWADNRYSLAPGTVLVAPPRSFLEVMPDGACVLSPCKRGALDKPIDRLLESVARSFAQRAIAVVLSGMLDDGASGAVTLRTAGGTVIAQSDAEYASMPQAAIRSGGADLALPLHEIALLLRQLGAGAAIPRPVTELESVAALFAGDGPARAAMRAVSWSSTPLGPVTDWSPALTTTVRNVMSSTFPSCIFWGPELVQIYNEAFLPLLGAKPSPAGKPARLTWPELWSSLRPRLESVLLTGEAVCAEDQLFQLERHGYPEELYLTYSYSALHDTDGTVRGVLNTSTETTGRVRASRRLKVLRDLAALESGESPMLVAESTARVLADAPLDVPFALFYLFDKGRTRATLAASSGIDAGTAAAPQTLSLSDDRAVWPLGEVARTGIARTLNDLASRLLGVHIGPWPEPSTAATLLPLKSGADGPIAGVVVLGSSPRLRFDPSYEDFLRVIAQQVSTAIGEAEARRTERERGDRLAELDQTKVEFFSNVSHEFRTPLTLLLGPIEEILGRRGSLPGDLEAAFEAAARNGRRLLTLVNTLLDFSETEEHQRCVHFEPTDLAALTSDIASAFRSAIEAAGLRFEVRCAEGIQEVWVDRQMWERIVSNLLANALKFTFDGEITVVLKALSLHVELVVSDTGIGIPERELPNLFKRFHRVRGARARTQEGSGIGLSIVHDHVARMAGQLRVRSTENAGTAFTIWIPYKSARIDEDDSRRSAAQNPTQFASQLAREASRWATDSGATARAPSGVLAEVFGEPEAMTAPASAIGPPPPRGRILVVDDNADMRDYLDRLLSPRWQVEVAADGARAFEAALRVRPDVVLADVMMPGLDGFELLERVRAQPELRHTPVVLLTARAGEEAAIQGLLAGADDYIAKPFSPRELVARLAAAVERARAEAALRESEERFRTLFETMQAGFGYLEIVRDSDGRAIDLFTIEANDAFAQHVGVEVARLRGRRWSEALASQDAADRRWLDLYNRVVLTGEPERRELLSPVLGRWFTLSAYPRGGDRFAVLLSDITERKLRALEQEFLLKLSDALRPLADASAIRGAATRVLGELLDADRVLYAEIAPGGETASIQDGYARDGVPAWSGALSLDALGAPIERLRRGDTVVIADDDGAGAARASVSVPHLAEARLAAILAVHDGKPRRWSDDEVALVRETAERTWAAVERARAESELLARNDELERFHGGTAGRELRLTELKQEVNALRRRLSEPPDYPRADDDLEDDGALATRK